MGVIRGKRKGKYFWGRGLDGANRIDLVQEIRRCAQSNNSVSDVDCANLALAIQT